jgi:hypothetical protein
VTRYGLLSLVLLARLAQAGPVATSCSYADVSAAVALAAPGDTVSIPACAETVWDSTLSLTRGVLLQGAGSGATSITAGATVDYLVSYQPAQPAADDPFRIAGITFNLSSSAGLLHALMDDASLKQTKFRIDHNVITGAVFGHATLLIEGPFFGVVDNNTVGDSPQFEAYGVPSGSGNWINSAFSFGSADCLYYEDNVIQAEDTMFSAGNGGRYCFRYNSITADPGVLGSSGLYPMLDAHGNMGVGDNWSTMGIEIYGNLVTMTNAMSPDIDLVDHRGGKAVIFYNQVKGSGVSESAQVREEHDDSLNPPATDAIDGTPQHVNNSYYWNNRYGTTLYPWMITDNLATYKIAENVDFWQQGASFDGSVGVGVGPLASRPGTCTVGVGYWATNDAIVPIAAANVGRNPSQPLSGTLYRCTAANTWTTFYTPYTYPHPLRGGASAPDAGSPDAGGGQDAGHGSPDAGVPDAGASDAGAGDAGDAHTGGPAPCGCNASPPLPLSALWLLLAVVRRLGRRPHLGRCR